MSIININPTVEDESKITIEEYLEVVKDIKSSDFSVFERSYPFFTG
jgi:hypothetical protein